MSELTLEDIAKLVGVHRSTVSRVINGSANVSPEVRQRVLDVIRETGYHPNAAARSLASQRSNMIGLVLAHSVSSFFTDPYFPHLTQGIAFGCNKYDLTLSLFLLATKEDEEKISPRLSRSGMLDGLLIQSGQPDDMLIHRLIRSRVPTVILGRPNEPEGVNYIDVDNLNASITATKHLIHLGYRRIATITGTRGSTVTADRLSGYKKALSEANLPIDSNLIAEGAFTENGGYTAMQMLLPAKPDAVFAASDIMAAGAMRAVQEAGLRVPEDVAFIGFDDVPLAAHMKIQLTTIRQPILKFGISAVEFLIDLIEKGTTPPRSIILDTELIVRNSCGAIQKGAYTAIS